VANHLTTTAGTPQQIIFKAKSFGMV